MATILRANGAQHELKGLDQNGTLSLAQMQEAVGGSVQLIELRDHVLLVNEDGIPLGLPVNEQASLRYSGMEYLHLPEEFYGDVVIASYEEVG